MAIRQCNPLKLACLSCRSRRVRCDATKPSCLRCGKDDIVCPGYVKIRRWRGPSSRQRTTSQTGAKDDIFHSKPDQQRDRPAIRDPSKLLLPDSESLLTLDCIKCYNDHMIPFLVPDHPPFARQYCHAVYWQDMPQLLRQLVIVSVRTAQAVKNRKDPLSNPEICLYRGRTLAELKEHILDAYSEPHGIILCYVLILLLTDFQRLSPGSKYHLDAARNIITFRGGFGRCYRRLASARPLLVNYMFIDIFTGTACTTSGLKAKSLETQLHYIDFLPSEEEILSQAYTCPKYLLKNIVHTTLLRAFREDPTLVVCKRNRHQHDFSTIMLSICGFDVSRWAKRVVSYGQVHPQQLQNCASNESILSWSRLAECWKSAALLYLLLSCASAESCESMIAAENQTLIFNIQRLLDIGSLESEGPIEKQLWKFLGWPSMMSAYVRAGWNAGENSNGVSMERLHEIVKDTYNFGHHLSPWLRHGLTFLPVSWPRSGNHALAQ